MNVFKGRHFSRDIILWAVRWYCKYGISYRELQEMLAERGVSVDHTTLYRWVQRYALKWRNVSAGTGVSLPGLAHGIWMKLISKLTANGLICTAQSTAKVVLLIFISPHAETVKPHTALWENS